MGTCFFTTVATDSELISCDGDAYLLHLLARFEQTRHRAEDCMRCHSMIADPAEISTPLSDLKPLHELLSPPQSPNLVDSDRNIRHRGAVELLH